MMCACPNYLLTDHTPSSHISILQVKITLDVVSRATTQRRRKDEDDDKFLKRLTHINLSDKKIEAIEGLDECINLGCLYLTENNIRVIQNLDFAQSLTHLYLQDNNIDHMMNLEPLYNLQKLFIGGNNIQEIRGLESCANLQELHVQAQRLPPDQPLMWCPDTLNTICETLCVLNAQKNNISQPSQLAVLRGLQRLDLSMNNISSFEEIGALFGDDACMNMSTLELRNNPVSKQHKLRDYIALMSPTLSTLDGREITQVERRFLVNREAAKARSRNRNPPMNAMNNASHFGPPQGVEGQLLMETQVSVCARKKTCARARTT